MQDQASKSSDSASRVFNISVSSDCMRVLLTCRTNDIDAAAVVEEIKQEMTRLNIRAKFNEEALANFLKQSKEKGEDLNDFVLAKGIPSMPSIDGKLEWQGDYFKEGYYIDPETKRIDFHRKVGDPTIEEGQLIVKVFKSKRGTDGIDVYGRAMKVPIPKTVTVNPGNNVVWDEEAQGYRAKKSGRVRFKGVTLHVDDTYVAREGINTNTGNVKHLGSVVVNGDIDSEFAIEASGNIEVRGLIYASDIICGGNLIAKEGINENPSKTVDVKGDILAKYIMNANIKCEGQVIANKEVFQSDVKCRGEVHCEKGRMVGGEIMATKGIFVGEVGSKGDAKTLLIAGIDYSVKVALETNTKKIEDLKLQIKKLKPIYVKLKGMRQFLKPEQAEAMTELEFQLNDSETEIVELDKQNKELRKEYYSNKEARIVIYEMAYPGTILRVFDSQYIIENALKGPIVAGIDPVTAEIFLTSELKDME